MASEVGKSYDAITKSHQGKNETAPFRSFNNFVKKNLIRSSLDIVSSNFSKSKAVRVLDLASGRGGDIGKWFNARSNGIPPARVQVYDCFDVSSESIKEAERRYQQIASKYKVKASFQVADCFGDEFLEHQLPQMPLYGKYQIVSIQFAFHYACENQDRIQKVMKAIVGALDVGGVFIATTVDEHVLTEYVRNANEDSLFSIQLLQESVNWVTDSTTEKPLLPVGSQYHFRLNGFVDSPEFIVPQKLVSKIALINGLNEWKELSQPFSFFLEQFNATKEQEEIGSLSSAELELVKLYKTLCFVKGNSHKRPTMKGPQQGVNQPTRVDSNKRHNEHGNNNPNKNSTNKFSALLDRENWGKAT